VASAVGDEVAEANFKPATALSFATETLPERKVACITAFTSEVARHANPAALEAVNRELLGGLGAAADRLFFRYVVDTVGAADIAASDIAEDEIGPRHPRAAEPPPALFLELNPALRARSNQRQKPAIHELVFVVGPEQRHIARIAAIDAPKINAIWRAALVHRASDRRTGLAVGRNEASHGLVPLLLRQ